MRRACEKMGLEPHLAAAKVRCGMNMFSAIPAFFGLFFRFVCSCPRLPPSSPIFILVAGKQASQFFAERDKTGTGRISFPEFVRVYTDTLGPPRPVDGGTHPNGVSENTASTHTNGADPVQQATPQRISSRQYVDLVRQLRLAERNREFALSSGHRQGTLSSGMPAASTAGAAATARPSVTVDANDAGAAPTSPVRTTVLPQSTLFVPFVMW